VMIAQGFARNSLVRPSRPFRAAATTPLHICAATVGR
jgi:hypothetical protein